MGEGMESAIFSFSTSKVSSDIQSNESFLVLPVEHLLQVKELALNMHTLPNELMKQDEVICQASSLYMLLGVLNRKLVQHTSRLVRQPP